MTKGRKKLPQEMLDLRGTARVDRRRDIEKGELIKDATEVLNATGIKYLKGKRAKGIFTTKCNQLIALRLMEETYIDSMVLYAYNFNLILECMEDVNKTGLTNTTTTAKGFTMKVENPHLRIMREATKLCNQIGSNFGFTPVDRQKLNMQTEVINPLKELMRKLDGGN